jgi:hypothetical protein
MRQIGRFLGGGRGVCALALRAFDARRPLRSPLNRYDRHAARYDHPLAGANLAVGVQAAIGQPCEPGATGVRDMFHFLVVGVACLDRFGCERTVTIYRRRPR